MRKHNRSLRLAMFGSCLILLVSGTIHSFRFLQEQYINNQIQWTTELQRNEWGHRPNAYRWYLDPNDHYIAGDDSWIDRGTTK